MKPQSTSKPVALVVIAFIGAFALLALGATWDLIRYELAHASAGNGIDPAAVGFIATMSGLCGTALGFVGGSLVQTEKTQAGTNIQQADNVQSGGPTLTPPKGE